MDSPQVPFEDSSHGPTHHRLDLLDRRHRRRRRTCVVLVVVGVVVAALAYPVGSLVRAMNEPGYAPTSARAVDWLRDMGAGGLVNSMENVLFRCGPTPNLPSPGDLPAHGVPARPATGLAPAALVPQPGLTPQPGEGSWTPRASTSGGTALYSSFVRPMPGNAKTVSGVLWINQRLAATRLIAGTRQPGGSGWPDGARVPGSLVPWLLATFNSGYKMVDARGGFHLDGRTAYPLRDGAASAVIGTDGTVAIGRWGRDLRLTGSVRAVRQNLDLVVDRGDVVPGLTDNAGNRWGSAGSQLQCTWRSGLGTDAQGDLLYVAGNHLTLDGLARALRQAGAVRGMALDIHPGMVDCTLHRPDLAGAGPTALVPAMPGPVTRYLKADQRDFFAVTARSPSGA